MLLIHGHVYFTRVHLIRVYIHRVWMAASIWHDTLQTLGTWFTLKVQSLILKNAETVSYLSLLFENKFQDILIFISSPVSL